MPWVFSPDSCTKSPHFVRVWIDDEHSKSEPFSGRIGILFDASGGWLLQHFFMRLFVLHIVEGRKPFLHKPFGGKGRPLRFERERPACYYEVDEQCFDTDAIDIVSLFIYDAIPGFGIFMPSRYWNLVEQCPALITVGWCDNEDSIQDALSLNPYNNELASLVSVLDDAAREDLNRQLREWTEWKESKGSWVSTTVVD